MYYCKFNIIENIPTTTHPLQNYIQGNLIHPATLNLTRRRAFKLKVTHTFHTSACQPARLVSLNVNRFISVQTLTQNPTSIL